MGIRGKKYWIIAIIVSLVVGLGTYSIVNSLSEEESRELFIKEGGKQVELENVKYSVERVENLIKEHAYRLELRIKKEFEDIENLPKTLNLKISESVYLRSLENSILYRETNERTVGSLDWLFSPIASGAVFAALAAIRLRKPETRGQAATLLLENGWEQARVRDVELLAAIIKMKRFTIPELMSRVGTSKSTTYRTVRELAELGLIEETEEEKTPDSVRGKPSKVYRYTETG